MFRNLSRIGGLMADKRFKCLNYDVWFMIEYEILEKIHSIENKIEHLKKNPEQWKPKIPIPLEVKLERLDDDKKTWENIRAKFREVPKC